MTGDEGPLLRRVGGLLVVNGPDCGLLVPLDVRPVEVGRETGCQVRLSDASASRKHFRLAPAAGGRWSVEDLRSRNGTFVCERRIDREEVGVDDEIMAGETRLQLLSAEQVAETLRARAMRATDLDPVSGVCSRNLFDLRLRTEVALAARTESIFSLALLEIDRAQAFESQQPGMLGRILPAVALTLGGFLRDSDLLARFGEESFAVLILNIDPSDAYLTAERMCSGTQFVMAEERGRPVPVTSSVGLVTLKGRRDLTAGEVVARARGQLSLAREAGGNCVSRWIHVAARVRIPSLSTDISPTEMDEPRKTRTLPILARPAGRPTLPPPSGKDDDPPKPPDGEA
jgi:diguanylate cyclase (GGDEF)-like protein